MNREDVAMDVTVQNVEILRGRLEQAENLLQAVVDEHGELSCDLHEQIDIFLASQQGERNQCDGCQAGIPLVDGAHRMGRQGGYPDLMSCQKERYEHPEQAEGAQGERKRFEAEVLGLGLPVERDHHGAYVSDHVRHLWSGWELRAALAQPSPAEDMSAAQELAGVKAILNDMADALKRLTFHARTTGGTAGPDAALMNACERAERILSLGGMGAAFMRGCDEHESQPSPAAPELEAPTSVGVLILGGAVSSTELGDNDVTLDGQVVERIQRELVSDSEDVAVELMIVGQHYRILQALRADRDNARRTAEYWKAEHLAANAALDAALARVAELERGKVYVEARQCDECQHGGINDSATGVAACHECDWTGPEPEEDRCPGCQRENCMAAACPQCGARYVLVASEEIAAPVAQAQHSVPEVSGIGRDFAYPRSVVLYLRTEPTDDDLRAIHDGLRSLAAAPGKEVGHE